MTFCREDLLSLADPGNAEFEAKLTPCGRRFLGARMPALRKLAKKIAEEDLLGYLDSWEPEFFEDYMLRGLATAYARVPLEEKLRLYAGFIPLIDSWSVCDSFCSTWKPKPEDKALLWDFIVPDLESGDEFRMRFAAVMMLDHFIDADHIDAVISAIDRAECEGYYYRMAAAWCLAECMAAFPGRTASYLRSESRLDVWIRLKAIQKSLESYRVGEDAKAELREIRASLR